KPSQLVMQHGMTGAGIVKFWVLFRCREFGVNEEVGELEIMRFLWKVVNGISRVIQEGLVRVAGGGGRHLKEV
uniref:hypothetical protein n=1 Tax=Neisseria sicca TaxID=490 RepID=UPI003F689EDC